MPKRKGRQQGIQNLNQTITQSVEVNAWDSVAFSKLLSEQAKSNETAIKNLESAMASAGANQQQLAEQITQSSMIKDIRDVLMKELEDRQLHDKLETLKKNLLYKKKQELELLEKEKKLKEDAIAKSKELNKIRSEENKAIANMAKSVASLKTFGERLSDFGKKLKDSMSPSNMRIAALSKMNFLGIFSKAIDKEKFIKAQKAAGDTRTRAEIAERFEGAYKTSKGIQKVDKEFEENRKLAGLSAAEYAKTLRGKELKGQRNLLAEEHAKHDVRAQYLRQTDEESPTEKFADKGAQEERDIEDQKQVEAQSNLLTKIEQNTRDGSPDQKAKPKEEDGSKQGGLLGKLMGGGGMGKALASLKDFGVGLVLVAGSLWVAAKAFQQFSEVDWGGMTKGLIVLGGLVIAGKALSKLEGDLKKAGIGLMALSGALLLTSLALQSFDDVNWESLAKGTLALGALVIAALAIDKVKGQIITGALALGVLDLALWGMGKAMQEFNEVSWEGMLKAGVAIAGFAAGVTLLGALLTGPQALFFTVGVAAVTAMGAAIWVLGEGMQAAGAGMSSFIDGIKQLNDIGGENLLKVAAGMTAIGAAFAAFGAGQAVAGLSNLATKFFAVISGQKTPVEQLIEIGQNGEGVEKAGIGMQKLSEGMKAFSEIKSGSLKQLKDFPWEEATKFVAANGSMTVDSAKVYNASKENADGNAQAEGKQGGGTTVVNAPVNNVQNTTNQTMRPPIRNTEPSQKRVMGLRYANDF